MFTINNVIQHDSKTIIVNIHDTDNNTYNNLFLKKSKWYSVLHLISDKLTDFMVLGSTIRGIQLFTPEDTYTDKEGVEHHYKSTSYKVVDTLQIDIEYEEIVKKKDTIKSYNKINKLLDELLEDDE
jgi:hypothetical protein